MPIQRWRIISVRIIVVIMWWIMIRKQVKCVRNRQRRDMRMSRHGLVDRHGHCMDTRFVTAIPMIRNILIKHRKSTILSLPIKICRKISYPIGILMLPIFRMNRVMPRLLPVQLPHYMKWKTIFREMIIRLRLIKSWRVLARRLTVQQ